MTCRDVEKLIAKFFEPPLYSRRVGFTTVYTAVYLPAEGLAAQ
jgi:hypothetical protein